MLEPDEAETLPDADLIIDGLLGFSLEGDPRGEAARLIRLANDHPARIVAIDLPSGLDATSGRIGAPCIRAAMTVTLALPKSGLMMVSRDLTGDMWVADIGVPPTIYQRFRIQFDADLFASDSLYRVR